VDGDSNVTVDMFHVGKGIGSGVVKKMDDGYELFLICADLGGCLLTKGENSNATTIIHENANELMK
jgi:hypothetical protein